MIARWDTGPIIPKTFQKGTHRATSPDETIDGVRRMTEVMGITRISNITGLDVIGIPVVTVCRPNARSLAIAQGKGLDLASAKASGVMEAVELFHAERISLPLRLASYNELRFRHRLVDLAGLPRVSASAFHPNLRLLWIEGTDVLVGEPVWVPFELAHTDFTLPLPTGSGAFLASSNGLASGNHLLEAVSHGLCEVVERDASTLWRLSDERSRRQTRLDLTTVDDSGCCALLEKYNRAGVDVAVWETTSDIGIASFSCVVVDRSPSALRPLYPSTGSGCHPAREIALIRTLTEAAQSRLTGISGARDDLSHGIYRRSQNLDAQQRVREEMRVDGPTRSFRDVPTHYGETLNDDVLWELERLRSIGIGQVVVIDLTRVEFKIPVARVVIPGLEPLHKVPGYKPGPRAQRRLAERRS